MFKYNMYNEQYSPDYLWRVDIHTTGAMTPGVMVGWMQK
jgi:hypothetical protein